MGQAKEHFAIRKCHREPFSDPNIKFGLVIPCQHWRKFSTEQLKNLTSVMDNHTDLDNRITLEVIHNFQEKPESKYFASLYKMIKDQS